MHRTLSSVISGIHQYIDLQRHGGTTNRLLIHVQLLPRDVRNSHRPEGRRPYPSAAILLIGAHILLLDQHCPRRWEPFRIGRRPETSLYGCRSSPNGSLSLQLPSRSTIAYRHHLTQVLTELHFTMFNRNPRFSVQFESVRSRTFVLRLPRFLEWALKSFKTRTWHRQHLLA